MRLDTCWLKAIVAHLQHGQKPQFHAIYAYLCSIDYVESAKRTKREVQGRVRTWCSQNALFAKAVVLAKKEQAYAKWVGAFPSGMNVSTRDDLTLVLLEA